MKLGKDEPTSSQDDSTTPTQKIPDIPPRAKPSPQQEKRPEPERKIIKFDTPEKSSDKNDASSQDPLKKPVIIKTENNPNAPKISSDKAPGATADAAREELEQRRNILQNMKDFDFQIKKNQEEITNIYEKVESLSKDLDDLVSLYEIVSEQMNPFVGLSKVTKKRLDALENIIKEVDGVKTRIGDLESTLEKNGVAVKAGTNAKKPQPTLQPNTTPGVAGTANGPQVLPSLRPTGVQISTMERLNEREIDDLLDKSFESLLMDQKIDAMINEFFINLK